MNHHVLMDNHARHTRPGSGEKLTYRQKHAQANREALYTVAGLVATIIVWTVLGFGLSLLDVSLFHTPVWVIGGTIGTWIFSIALVVFFGRRLFRNFSLDDDGSHEAEKRVDEGGERDE